MGTKGFANTAVAALLGSPFHGVLSSKLCLVRYRGRRSGTEFTTPTQYAVHDGGVVVLVGRPERKTWWRNFTGPDGGDVELLLRRRWVPMRGRAVIGADSPDETRDLLASYLAAFPRATAVLDGETNEERARSAVMVRFRP